MGNFFSEPLNEPKKQPYTEVGNVSGQRVGTGKRNLDSWVPPQKGGKSGKKKISKKIVNASKTKVLKKG